MRLPRQFTHDLHGHRIAYAQIGCGPPVLLLHGLGGTADFWQPVVMALATTNTLIVPDLLGFGASDKPRDPPSYTPESHGRAVQAVLRAVSFTTLHGVVGHSCGGVIALHLLATTPHATARLCLAATPYPSPRFAVREELLTRPLDRLMLSWPPFAKLLHHTLHVAWPLLRHYPVPLALRGAWEGYMEHTIASYVGTAEACLFQANLDPQLARLAAQPTLILAGERDHTIPLVHSERLAAVLPHSRLAVIAGDHHAVITSGLMPLVRWVRAASNEPDPVG